MIVGARKRRSRQTRSFRNRAWGRVHARNYATPLHAHAPMSHDSNGDGPMDERAAAHGTSYNRATRTTAAALKSRTKRPSKLARRAMRSGMI